VPKGQQITDAADNAESGGKKESCPPKKKPVNLPSWKKVKIDMEEVESGHTATGSRALQSGKKDLFPSNWSSSKIEKAIRQAYRYGERMGSQGERVFVQGQGGGLRIQMWVNTATKTIETAWPK
jgi:hypothetical protein